MFLSFTFRGVCYPFFLSFINNLQKATRLPPETLTIEGAITLPSKNPDFRKSVNDSFCLLRFPDNTALTQQFQFPVLSGLEPFSGRAVDAGLVKTEELPGNLKGQTRYSILSESDLPSTAKRMGFLRPKGESERSLLSGKHGT